MKTAKQFLSDNNLQDLVLNDTPETLPEKRIYVSQALDRFCDQFRYARTTCGKQIMFDDEDYIFLRNHALFIRNLNGDVLTVGKTKKGGKTGVPIAKLLLGETGRVCVHYKDGNRLNLKRDNISIKTSQKAHFAQKKSKNNTSGYKGVSWNRNAKKFSASIRANGKSKYLGYFDTAEEAAEAYNKGAMEHFGEYAKLNVITPKTDQ